MAKVQWRLRQTRISDGKSQLVWATYSTKKQATKIANSFNKLNSSVKVDVIRQEGNDYRVVE